MTAETIEQDAERRVRADRKQQVPGEAKPRDPAPHPIDVARVKAENFVVAISTNTLLALRERRDELDNTMERITKSERALTHYIGEFAKFNYEALELTQEIRLLIDRVATPFKGDPPATITQVEPKLNGSH